MRTKWPRGLGAVGFSQSAVDMTQSTPSDSCSGCCMRNGSKWEGCRPEAGTSMRRHFPGPGEPCLDTSRQRVLM